MNRRLLITSATVALLGTALFQWFVTHLARVDRSFRIRGDMEFTIISMAFVTLLVASLCTLWSLSQDHVGWRRVAMILTPLAPAFAAWYANEEARRGWETVLVFVVMLPVALIALHGGVLVVRKLTLVCRGALRWVAEGFRHKEQGGGHSDA